MADAASPNGKANFGFNVKAGRKGEQVKGNLTFIFHGADGFSYIGRSNTWRSGYLQFAAEPCGRQGVRLRGDTK